MYDRWDCPVESHVYHSIPCVCPVLQSHGGQVGLSCGIHVYHSIQCVCPVLQSHGGQVGLSCGIHVYHCTKVYSCSPGLQKLLRFYVLRILCHFDNFLHV